MLIGHFCFHMTRQVSLAEHVKDCNEQACTERFGADRAWKKRIKESLKAEQDRRKSADSELAQLKSRLQQEERKGRSLQLEIGQLHSVLTAANMRIPDRASSRQPLDRADSMSNMQVGCADCISDLAAWMHAIRSADLLLVIHVIILLTWSADHISLQAYIILERHSDSFPDLLNVLLLTGARSTDAVLAKHWQSHSYCQHTATWRGDHIRSDSRQHESFGPRQPATCTRCGCSLHLRRGRNSQ